MREIGDPREENLRVISIRIYRERAFVYARNTCGGKMVSSFRALSFASRVLDEKKKEREG